MQATTAINERRVQQRRIPFTYTTTPPPVYFLHLLHTINIYTQYSWVAAIPSLINLLSVYMLVFCGLVLSNAIHLLEDRVDLCFILRKL